MIGLGEAGATIHLPALGRVGDAEVVGAYDLDPTRLEEAGRRWGVKGYGSFEDVLSYAQPEVVIIGTPPEAHHSQCMAALEAGCHVICEKPFVSSLREADELISAARSARRSIALNHEFKEMPILRALRAEAAKAGEGEPRFVQAWQLMDRPPWAEGGWRGELRHRSLYEAGIHIVDLFVALFGAMPVSVSASISSGGETDQEVDAVVAATLEFPGNRLGQIVQTRLCRGDARYFEVRMDTAEASFRASHGGRARVSAGLLRSMRPHLRVEYGSSGLAWKEVGRRRKTLARNPGAPLVDATATVFRETLEAFRNGRHPPVAATEARDLLGVIVACYQSAREGRRIGLDANSLASMADTRLGFASGDL